jgi:hypothetical protein
MNGAASRTEGSFLETRWRLRRAHTPFAETEDCAYLSIQISISLFDLSFSIEMDRLNDF